MSMVTITVNDKQLEVDNQKMLIEELHRHGISVPHFCYHEALGVDGNCRMCMVDIKGQKRPQIACNTPIKESMEVSTVSDMIMGVKRDILELELINHPVDCPICDQAGECSLQDYYMEVGLNHSRVDIAHKTKKEKHVNLGSNVMLDQERCVLCARCTRFTQNITKTDDLIIANRGNHACVTTFDDDGLKAKGYAMNVVDLCPVGALTSKDFRFNQRVWFLQSDETICHGCSKGCNIYMDHNAPKYEDDLIYRFRPRINHDVNGHFICDEGRLSYKNFNKNVLETPLLNNQPLTLESAIQTFKNELTKHKMETIALVSPSLSFENLASIQLFCDYYQIPLYGAEKESLDKSHADDMLKTDDLAANRKALNLLDISSDEHKMQAAIENATLIVNFDNLAPIEHKKCVHFVVHAKQSKHLQLPIAPYTQQSGTIMNEDGILQTFTSTIKRSNPTPNVRELLALISNDVLYADIKHLTQYLSEKGVNI